MYNFSILAVAISMAELPALLLADLLTETVQLLQELLSALTPLPEK
ncbi:hypothetical protein SAMN04488128_101976 [Chitinophaga eiseniae]|uniref:Uncharacterized protein n=1 Tax=Chitinophaga eiseniae TaxID=634771 RepID=A0A1T4M7U6_9BACT|nr:hypothetical protein [Chitinophaga eiseniae]SJZ62916.1 hypothetical protein SAMN04488128_101976 [Chitinophaga eiseniae]